MSRTGETNASETANGSTVDNSENTAAEPETQESKKDQPTADAAKEPAKANPVDAEPRSDESKFDQLVARLSADEAKIDHLLAVNRELGLFFEDQLDATESLRKSAEAIHGFLQSEATLKKKFDQYMQSAGEGSAGEPDVQKMVRLRGILGRLQRFGSL